jgi:hypothetical protein
MTSSKKIYWIFGIVFLIISLAMVAIVKRGVTLKLQPLIKPTQMEINLEPMARHLFLRLFPDFQQAEYVIWNFESETKDTKLFYSQISSRFESEMKKINFFDPNSSLLEDCLAPCWMTSTSLSQLTELKQKFAGTDKKWIVIHWKSYHAVEDVSEVCLNQKVLSEDCIRPVAVNDVKKRLKDPKARYFFLKKYLDRDFYLFVKSLANE